MSPRPERPDCIVRLLSALYAAYIRLVYRTSRVTYQGATDVLRPKTGERFIFGAWHGENIFLLPVGEGKRALVLTTADRRGDYIAALCRRFGAEPIRAPDGFAGGDFIRRLCRRLRDGGDLAIALDGPLGPYHEPKPLAFVLAMLSGRRLVPVTVQARRAVRLHKRWDRFAIPLPFNLLTVRLHPPLRIERSDRKEDFQMLREQVRRIMEQGIVGA